MILRSLNQHVLVAVDRRTETVSDPKVFERGRVHRERLSHVIAARSEESRVDIISIVGKVRRSGRSRRELRKVTALVLLLLDLRRRCLTHGQGSEADGRVRLGQAIPLCRRGLLRLCDPRLVGGTVSLGWFMAVDGLTEPGETHPRGVAIRNRLHEDGILSDLIPVDLEVCEKGPRGVISRKDSRL